MLFNSFEFAAFFAVFYALYRAMDHRNQNRLLLVASYVFYGWWDWRFLGLLGLSTLVDWYVGKRIGAAQGADRLRERRIWVYVSVAINLTVLGFFKYFNFFAETLVDLLHLIGLQVSPVAIDVVLPVGISFYTFQALSYTISVYRGTIPAVRSPIEFAVYVSYFPQLAAGPIEKSHHLLPQIQSPRVATWEGLWSGAWLFLWGLFKKVVVADACAPLVQAAFRSGATPTGFQLLVGAYAFTWQIYCDFSGYSDMARGLARTMGIDLMVNFDTPFFSRNLAEFWRRWHISLSGWFREYVYIPLGGNRRGRARWGLNLFLIFLVSGLWHGAAGRYVVWGALHGVAVAVLTLWAPAIERGLSWIPQVLRRPLGIFLTFHYVVLAFSLWQVNKVSDWLGSLHQLLYHFDLQSAHVRPLSTLLGLVVLPLALEAILQRSRDLLRPLQWPVAQRAALYAVVLFAVVRFGVFEGAQFIYFQF